MELLKSLGIDLNTLWMHVLCFAVGYLSLSNLVFKPYVAALKDREGRTVGGEELAQKLLIQAVEMDADYEQKAKAISASIRTEYEKNRQEALRESEALIGKARMEAFQLLESSRATIAMEITAAKSALSGEVPSIAAAITAKMAGKEISL
jgi:F-type H+-transporting ATPase subunit b